MESATYLSSQNKIYGVRGQWIYECDPVSGSILRSGRFCDNALFRASIVAVGTKLYVGIAYTDRWDYNNTMPGCDIFAIDPTALPFPTAVAFGWDTTKLNGIAPPIRLEPGWNWLASNGTNIWGWSGYEGMFRVDPTNLASYIRTSQSEADGCALDSTAHAGFAASPYVWITDSRNNDLHIFAGDFTDDTTDTGGVTTALGGITFCDSTVKVYAVKGTEDFYKVDGNAPFVAPPFLSNFAVSTLHLAPVAGVLNPQPARIRACNVIGHPSFGKVFIPTLKGDQVVVWDSASDLTANAVCKTGFSAPLDIVFTPTRTFAIQNSATGLREVV